MKQLDSDLIENLKILVCCHKKTSLPNNDLGVFIPIQVGTAISHDLLEMERDDKFQGGNCDNISNKNQSYCELTALYRFESLSTIL